MNVHHTCNIQYKFIGLRAIRRHGNFDEDVFRFFFTFDGVFIRVFQVERLGLKLIVDFVAVSNGDILLWQLLRQNMQTGTNRIEGGVADVFHIYIFCRFVQLYIGIPIVTPMIGPGGNRSAVYFLKIICLVD